MESELWTQVYLYNIIDPCLCYDKELDNYKDLSIEAIDYLFTNKSKTEYKSYYISTIVYDKYSVITDFQITISNNTIIAKANDNSYEIKKSLENFSLDIPKNFISSNINSNEIYSYKDNDICIETIYFTPKELKLDKNSELVNIIRPNSIYTNIHIKYRLVYDHVIDIIALLE